jgi:hypothetical protein
MTFNIHDDGLHDFFLDAETLSELQDGPDIQMYAYANSRVPESVQPCADIPRLGYPQLQPAVQDDEPLNLALDSLDFALGILNQQIGLNFSVQQDSSEIEMIVPLNATLEGNSKVKVRVTVPRRHCLKRMRRS